MSSRQQYVVIQGNPPASEQAVVGAYNLPPLPQVLEQHLISNLQAVPQPEPYDGVAKAHPLLSPGRDPTFRLVYDTLRPPQLGAYLLSSTQEKRSPSPHELLAPAFSSKPLNIRLSLNIPRAGTCWKHISGAKPITVMQILDGIYNALQLGFPEENWKALDWKTRQQIEYAMAARCDQEAVSAGLPIDYHDATIAGGVRWVDALMGKTQFLGLTGPDENAAALAIEQGYSEVEETWIVHFG